jgi:biotin carboxyl carrier protein
VAKYRVKVGERILEVEIEDISAHPVTVHVGDQTFEVWVQEEEGPRIEQMAAAIDAPAVTPPPAGPAHTIPDPLAVAAQPGHRPGGGKTVRAPMPGQIRAVPVSPGTEVARGELLCVLEAMKMNNRIRAPLDGVIAEVHVSPGAQVNYGDPLMRYE